MLAVGAVVIAVLVPCALIALLDARVAIEQMVIGVIQLVRHATVLIVRDGVRRLVVCAIGNIFRGRKSPIAVGDFIGFPDVAARIVGVVFLAVFEDGLQRLEQIVALKVLPVQGGIIRAHIGIRDGI